MNYLLIALLFILQMGYGINASPEMMILKQPDGESIECFHRGDEWGAWFETVEGWSITKTTSGYWVYAVGVDGRNLLPGTVVVGRGVHPEMDISGNSLEKHLKPEPYLNIEHSRTFNINSARTDSFKIPLLLVDFPDYLASYPDTIFNDIMNLEGYGHPNHPGSGSFRDFYQEISYGQFNPVTDVVDWVQAPNNHDYYAYSEPDGYDRVLELIRAAVDTAEAHGMDWSQYDNDGDGNLDALNVLHAGPGAEQGDHSNIWSHKWYLSAGGLEVQYDGVWINGYTMNPEIQNNNIVAIGVISHEFGHALGLPDLYDTDYSSSGAGKLALMASGSWGTSGNTPWYPSAMNAWSKTELDWSNPTVLDVDQMQVAIDQSFSNNAIYRVNHPQDNSEYWLIENRQKVGTDVNMPCAGLIIWHIDTEMTGGWGVNNNEPHYGVGLEQADGYFDLENDAGSDGGDPFPGFTDNRFFTNSTTPNTVNHYGVPSMVSIENISDPDSIMTFDLAFGEILMADVGITNSSANAYDSGWISINMDNTMEIATLRFRLNSSPDILSVAEVNLSDRVTADSILINNNLIDLVNPVIATGSGTIMDIELFANTGIDRTVELTLTNYYSADSADSEVALIVTNAVFQVFAIDQIFTVSNSSAPIGGPFQYTVALENSVPLKMITMSLNDLPDYLIAADEFYTDANGNNHWDAGEPFTDWNEDGEWTPAIQLSDRLAGWNFSMQTTSDGITLQTASWTTPVDTGQGTIFTVNGVVDISALTSHVLVRLNNVILMDKFGIDGIPFTYTIGDITITPFVGTDLEQSIPTEFSLSNNYPNPFNPTTTFNYQVPQTTDINFSIYDIRGNIVYSMTQLHNPGRYELVWNGRNNNGKNVASGTYFMQMKAADYSVTRKILLLK